MKQKKEKKQKRNLQKKLVKQTIASVIILGVIFSLNKYSNGVRYTDEIIKCLKCDVDTKSIYNSITNLINSSLNTKQENKKAIGTEKMEMESPVGFRYENIIEFIGPQQKKENSLEKNVKKAEFIPPINGVVGSGFGERIHPITKKKEFHKGIDIAGNLGDEIFASTDGVVQEAAKDSGFGNYIKIDHGNGYVTFYGHCKLLKVKKGEKVKLGQVIAEVGSTGLSNGPHVHFEIRKDGVSINPRKIIKI